MARTPESIDTAERLMFSTDAVAAIVLTLLVLPLVDLVPEAQREGFSLSQLWTRNATQVGAFLLSSAVIFRFWLAHHRLFRHISN